VSQGKGLLPFHEYLIGDLDDEEPPTDSEIRDRRREALKECSSALSQALNHYDQWKAFYRSSREDLIQRLLMKAAVPAEHRESVITRASEMA